MHDPRRYDSIPLAIPTYAFIRGVSQRKLSKRRLGMVLMGLVMVIGTGFAGAAWYAVDQTRHVPEFYSEALKRSPHDRELAENHLRRDVDQLRDDASRRGHWRATFDEEQINAWLAEHLPEKFAKWLHRGVSDPVIAVRSGELLAAVRFNSKRIDTVISCEMRVAMTAEPNLLAVQLSNLRAGALPLPLEPFVRRISREAALGDLEIRWDFTDEGPIALVKIPHEHEDYVYQPVVIESVDFSGGQLRLGGRTGQSATVDYSPRGPMHRFVRYRSRDASSTTNL